MLPERAFVAAEANRFWRYRVARGKVATVDPHVYVGVRAQWRLAALHKQDVGPPIVAIARYAATRAVEVSRECVQQRRTGLLSRLGHVMRELVQRVESSPESAESSPVRAGRREERF